MIKKLLDFIAGFVIGLVMWGFVAILTFITPVIPIVMVILIWAGVRIGDALIEGDNYD